MCFHQLLLTAVLIVAGGATAFAQDGATLAGRILDTQGAGIAGATVTLQARAPRVIKLTTLTDEGGAYRFEQLAPGEYLLTAEAVNFAPAPAREIIVGRAAAALDVTLEVAGVRAEIVVTAADAPQPIDEVSKAINVVDAREIEERNEYAVTDALRTVPGLRVQQLGGPGSLVSIKTRGLRNEDTAVLIDGLRFRDAAAITGDATGYLEDLLLTNTSRLEVLRGSGSSLYGTNAIGGVVNIVTDEGGGPLRGNVLAEGGGLGLFRGRAQIAGGAGAANRLAYSAGVSHFNVARGVDGDDAARTTSGQGRVLFRLTPTATLSARLSAADSFLQLNSNPSSLLAIPFGAPPPAESVEARPLPLAELRRYEAGIPFDQLNVGDANFIPSANDPDASRAARFFTGALQFAQQPAEAFGYTISYQALKTTRTLRNGTGGVPFQPFGGTSHSEFDGRIHTLNGRTDFRLGRAQLVTAGYEFESETYRNRSFLFTDAQALNRSDDSRVSATQRSHAFFIQDQVRLLDDRLQLSAAFRAQTFTLAQPEFTPAANAPYQGRFDAPPVAYTGDGSVAYFFRSTGTKLRGHVGNGYRAPSLFERFGNFFDSFSGNTFVPLGDPTLRPERSIAFDAGIDQTAFDNRLRASATYFYTRLQEVIGFGGVRTFNRFSGYLNTGGGLARGVELSLAAAPHARLDLSASYTYTNSDLRRPPIFGNDLLRSYVISDHQFSLVATGRLTRRLLLNFDLTATSDYLAPIFPAPAYRFRGPIKTDAGASYTLPLAEQRSVRLFGYVENLFDREYYESGFRTPGVTGRAGAQFNF